MSFWRDEVIEFALDHETEKHITEQRAWILSEPSNPRPYLNLARLYGMRWKPDESLGLLLEAVRLDEHFAEAHVALAELYAVKGDYGASWRHARAAERSGDAAAVELLHRHGVAEP
jgi:hypothetical protein